MSIVLHSKRLPAHQYPTLRSWEPAFGRSAKLLQQLQQTYQYVARDPARLKQASRLKVQCMTYSTRSKYQASAYLVTKRCIVDWCNVILWFANQVGNCQVMRVSLSECGVYERVVDCCKRSELGPLASANDQFRLWNGITAQGRCLTIDITSPFVVQLTLNFILVDDWWWRTNRSEPSISLQNG